MGSQCSVLNDTENEVWITHGVNWGSLIDISTGLFDLLTTENKIAALATPGGVTSDGRILVHTENGIVIEPRGSRDNRNATEWKKIDVFTRLVKEDLAHLLKISEEETDKIQKSVQAFKEEAKRIPPGEKYTWSGTLSLNMKVYTMNDKMQCGVKACFAGAIPGSENVYTISDYFKNLDVERKLEDTITVYCN